jgi:hypothetical protein
MLGTWTIDSANPKNATRRRSERWPHFGNWVRTSEFESILPDPYLDIDQHLAAIEHHIDLPDCSLQKRTAAAEALLSGIPAAADFFQCSAPWRQNLGSES